MFALEGHDAAPAGALSRREGVHAGLVAPLEDAVGQVAEALLDVSNAHLEDQLQAGQPGVVGRHGPGPRLAPSRVGCEDQLLQRERESVSGRGPGAWRPTTPGCPAWSRSSA